MPPEIDYKKCSTCKICMNICSEDVFVITKDFEQEKREKIVASHQEMCWHCAICVDECPEGAINLIIPLSMHVLYK